MRIINFFENLQKLKIKGSFDPQNIKEPELKVLIYIYIYNLTKLKVFSFLKFKKHRIGGS